MSFPFRPTVAAGLALALLATPGCAGRRKKREKAAALAAQADARPREIGEVTLVNPELGFALIDVDMGFAPPTGVALKTFPRGTAPAPDAETSILTVSEERRPPFLAVDVVRGEPQKGDAVYR